MADFGLFVSIKKTNIVTNMEKQVRRKYSPKGTRRVYTHMRVDTETRDKLKVLADKMKVPIVEAMKIAVELLEKDQVNEPG